MAKQMRTVYSTVICNLFVGAEQWSQDSAGYVVQIGQKISWSEGWICFYKMTECIIYFSLQQ